MERKGLRAALLIVVSSVAISCASQQTIVVWEKEGASAADLAAARAACLSETDDEQLEASADRMEAELQANAFVRCMEARGFRWKTEPAGG